MKIYTKTGDEGFTSLFGGTRISKDNIRIESYGSIDELNSFVGLLFEELQIQDVKLTLFQIQNRLFDIGSSLACDPEKEFKLESVTEEDTHLLESEIDRMESTLDPLKNFILPSGNKSIAVAHICRTVCRRAERRIVTLSNVSSVDKEIFHYLNRLSDYFFVCARYIAHSAGIADVKWQKKNQ
jgi:cob(I)alamin adenosyltransferase